MLAVCVTDFEADAEARAFLRCTSKSRRTNTEMRGAKEMKPVNVIKNDDNYREFLKLLVKIKSRKAFLNNGLTDDELEQILNPFYKSLKQSNLTGYNVWIKKNKAKIYENMKQMKKNPASVIAPQNIDKANRLRNFVYVINKLKKVDTFDNIMKNHKKVTEMLASEFGEKKSLTFVKQYLKDHSNDLSKIFDNADSDFDEDENEEMSSSQDENNIVSEIEERMEKMSTSNKSSDNESLKHNDMLNEAYPLGQSTPKRSEPSSPSSQNSLDENDAVLVVIQPPITQTKVDAIMDHLGETKSKLHQSDNDSGFDATNLSLTPGLVRREDDGDDENMASNLDNLISNLEGVQNKTGPLVGISSNTNRRSNNSKVSVKISVVSDSENPANKSLKSSMKRSTASIRDENSLNNLIEPGRKSCENSISFKNKRFKSTSISPKTTEKNSLQSSVVSIGNMEISFNKLANKENNELVSSSEGATAISSTSKHDSANSIPVSEIGISSANSSTADLQPCNMDTTWDSHKHFNKSLNLQDLNNYREQNSSYKTATSAISSSRIEEISPLSTNPDTSNNYATANETYNVETNKNSSNSSLNSPPEFNCNN